MQKFVCRECDAKYPCKMVVSNLHAKPTKCPYGCGRNSAKWQLDEGAKSK